VVAIIKNQTNRRDSYEIHACFVCATGADVEQGRFLSSSIVPSTTGSFQSAQSGNFSTKFFLITWHLNIEDIFLIWSTDQSPRRGNRPTDLPLQISGKSLKLNGDRFGSVRVFPTITNTETRCESKSDKSIFLLP
jgi:hypothetical protein